MKHFGTKYDLNKVMKNSWGFLCVIISTNIALTLGSVKLYFFFYLNKLFDILPAKFKWLLEASFWSALKVIEILSRFQKWID